MQSIGSSRQRKAEIGSSSGLLDRLCERETRREDIEYARRLFQRFGSWEEAHRQVELERARPLGRLKV